MMTVSFRRLRRATLAGGLSLLGLAAQAQVGIGTAAPDASALLELSTTTKGLLLPRLTLVQRNAIASPAAGLMIYQTDNTPGLYIYGGSSWSLLPAATQVADNLGNHTATQALNLGANSLVGQTNSGDAVGTTGLRVTSDGKATVGPFRTPSQESDRAGLEIHHSQGLLATGTVVTNVNITTTPPQEGAGTRLLWFPPKAAFRAGYINGTQWDGANLGLYSVAMGYNCRASADYATAFGNTCTAAQINSLAAGSYCTASGAASVALGNYAHTNARQGSFVFSDRSVVDDGNFATDESFRAPATNTFNVRCIGGFNFYTNTGLSLGLKIAAGGSAWEVVSDSTKKERLRLADGNELLRRVGRMRLGSWNYKGQSPDTMRHYGPMAQDFFAAFGHDGVGRVGHAKGINQADFDGVNLILIQALYRRV